MAFIADNPISSAELTSSPSTPPEGTRGIFPKSDGWYEIDDNGNENKIALSKEVNETKESIKTLPIKSLEGKNVENTKNNFVEAEVGATIIGDLREREFSAMNGSASGNVAVGEYAVAMGCGNTAFGDCTTAMGRNNYAGGLNAFVAGALNNSNSGSIIGSNNTSSNGAYITLGWANQNNGNGGVAIGGLNQTEGSYNTNPIAIGYGNYANGKSAIAMGYYNEAIRFQFVCGHFADRGSAPVDETEKGGNAFVIGNGTSSSDKSNCFRVGYNGSVYGLGEYNSSGADIAEIYEWADGNPNNEDRRGLFVTLDGTKIKLASPSDTYIKGVISAVPCLVGDSASEEWHGKYIKDVFGVPLTQTVHVPAIYEDIETIDETTGEKTVKHVKVSDEYDVEQYILNPEYDPTQEYTARIDRPEFDYVSNWGKVILVDDGTCEVNGFASVGDGGVATKALSQTPYRVMERRDDSHIYVAIG